MKKFTSHAANLPQTPWLRRSSTLGVRVAAAALLNGYYVPSKLSSKWLYVYPCGFVLLSALVREVSFSVGSSNCRESWLISVLKIRNLWEFNHKGDIYLTTPTSWITLRDRGATKVKVWRIGESVVDVFQIWYCNCLFLKKYIIHLILFLSALLWGCQMPGSCTYRQLWAAMQVLEEQPVFLNAERSLQANIAIVNSQPLWLSAQRLHKMWPIGSCHGGGRGSWGWGSIGSWGSLEKKRHLI